MRSADRDEAVMSLTSSMIMARQTESGSDVDDPESSREARSVGCMPSLGCHTVGALTCLSEEEPKDKREGRVPSADP